MSGENRVKGILLVIIGSMLWGVSGTVAQYLFQSKGISAEWLVVIRLLTAGILMLLYTGITEGSRIFQIWRDKKDAITLLAFSLFGMLGVQYTYFAAIKHGNAATATILQYLSPVVITLYLILRTKRMPGLREFISVVMAVAGVFLLVTKGQFGTLAISRWALIWGICSALTAAFYTIQPKGILDRWGSKIVVGWGMLIGGIAFSFVHSPMDFTGEMGVDSLLGIIFVVVFGTLIAFYLYLHSLNYIKPNEASILSSAEPLSAAFLSVIWLREPLALAQWVGIVCIIITIRILTGTKKEKLEVAG